MTLPVERDMILEVALVDAQPLALAAPPGPPDRVALLVGHGRREEEAALVDDVLERQEHAVDQAEIVLVLEADDLLAGAVWVASHRRSRRPAAWRC